MIASPVRFLKLWTFSKQQDLTSLDISSDVWEVDRLVETCVNRLSWVVPPCICVCRPIGFRLQDNFIYSDEIWLKNCHIQLMSVTYQNTEFKHYEWLHMEVIIIFCALLSSIHVYINFGCMNTVRHLKKKQANLWTMAHHIYHRKLCRNKALWMV